MRHLNQEQTLLVEVHGYFLVLRASGLRQKFTPPQHQLLAVQQRHLGVGGNVERYAF